MQWCTCIHKQIMKKINVTFAVIVLLAVKSIYKPMATANQASIYLPFYFLLPMVVCSQILQAAVAITATGMLHSIFCDIIEAVSECQALIQHF